MRLHEARERGQAIARASRVLDRVPHALADQSSRKGRASGSEGVVREHLFASTCLWCEARSSARRCQTHSQHSTSRRIGHYFVVFPLSRRSIEHETFTRHGPTCALRVPSGPSGPHEDGPNGTLLSL